MAANISFSLYISLVSDTLYNPLPHVMVSIRWPSMPPPGLVELLLFNLLSAEFIFLASSFACYPPAFLSAYPNLILK